MRARNEMLIIRGNKHEILMIYNIHIAWPFRNCHGVLGVILAWFASIKCSGRFVDGCCHRVLSDFVIQFFIKYGKNNYQ